MRRRNSYSILKTGENNKMRQKNIWKTHIEIFCFIKERKWPSKNNKNTTKTKRKKLERHVLDKMVASGKGAILM